MLKASFGWLSHWRTNMVLVPNLYIPDGSIPYLDVLIHADKTTSVYRKPTTPPPHRNPQKTVLSPPSLVELTPYALPVTWNLKFNS